MQPDGCLDLAEVEQVIKPEDFHFARTRLICLENTHRGRVLPLSYLEQAADLARRYGLGLHLDGARVFNAAVQLGVPVVEITRYFDSVSFCLSKGLGAPAGSVLCGSEVLIQRARRWRKVLGGGMRQVGILAAAGIYALENHVERLAQDHAHALALAQGLASIESIQVDLSLVQTNMVFMTVQPDQAEPLRTFLKQQGILIGKGHRIRLVTHLDVTAVDVERVIRAVQHYVAMEPLQLQPA